MPKKVLTLSAINERLADTGIRLYQRGSKLYLRATLPKKDGQPGEKQQWISLGFGLTPLELEQAEAKGWELHAQRVMKKFNWADWEDLSNPKSKKNCAEWIEKYKEHRLAQGLSIDSWDKSDGWYVRRLQQNEPLTEKALIDAALRSKPNTRDRKSACSALTRFARFAGLECDLSQYSGDYSYRKVKARKLPNDEQIVAIREAVFVSEVTKRLNQEWQWVYGMMATYGLRNHEIFYCQIEREPPYACRVSEGKTGSRIVLPLYPEWVERWQLFEMYVPQGTRQKFSIEDKSHLYLGHKVSNALIKYLKKLPSCLRHQPYDLRHCYALRGSVLFRIPVRVMANFMGHDVETHLKIYSRWLNQSDAEKVYLEGIAKSDRPTAP